MKTLFTFAATVLLSWVSLAALAATPPAMPSTANFVSERGIAFGLRLDGQPLTRPVARQVHVDRLAPGQHWADFSLPSPYGPPLRFRTAVWLESGFETSYVLVLRPGFGPQLRQVGAVPLGGPGYPLPAPGAPGSGPGGYYGGQPAAPGNYPSSAPYGNGNPNNAPYGNNPGAGPAGGYGGVGSGPAPASGGNYPGGNGAGNGDYYPNPAAPGPATGGYLYPLPPADVQGLTQALRSRPFDDERLPLVKQALAQGLVQAGELAGLIGTLDFDRSRIELAKYGYAHLSDPQNFYRVYDVLRYPSSIREVQQALGLPQY